MIQLKEKTKNFIELSVLDDIRFKKSWVELKTEFEFEENGLETRKLEEPTKKSRRKS